MYCEIHSPAEFASECAALLNTPDQSLLICIARHHHAELDVIVDALRSADVRFFGAVFPGLINQGKIAETGAIVQAVPLLAAPAVARIDGDEIDWTHPASELSSTDLKPTCIILADFACVAITTLMLELFNRHGNEVNYFGAGAGSGVRTPSPVVFSNEGVFTGSAIVAYVNWASEVKLRHGWSRIAGPVVATRTEHNVIKELDWEPAISVYRSLVGDEIAGSLEGKHDDPAAKRYPFGIAREDMEDVVRDPLVTKDSDDLVVLSDVPENSIIHVLHGNPDDLIAAAGRLGADFKSVDKGISCLIFDCYSRAMLLGDDIVKELQSFQDGFDRGPDDFEIEGVLALGEIASDGNRIPDFHNKTMAAVLFREN